jgi:ADP-ribose pyrophosphatase YjhB (NUDIX family)
MRLIPKFCAACGHRVETRDLDGYPRQICPACNRIHYRNPLPVAAALVRSAAGEILLVRRAKRPHQGAWCLPMGFAEIGETIDQAAQRELKEEAGIDARILHLVDAHSTLSDYYGDLLIVTFAMEKTGGIEVAGDDADDVRYFPVDDHPPLAFTANERALRIVTAAEPTFHP